MLKSFVHVEPLQLRLLSAGDNVDVVAGSQAMIEDAEKAVAVWRIVDANGVASACQRVVHKAGCLVAESVVIVSPCMACEQNIQRCDRFAPCMLVALLQPLGVLRHHRIDDLRESLIGGPHAMPTSKQVSFKPSLTKMFAQYFQHTATRAEFVVDRDKLSHRAALRSLEDGV